MWILDGSIPGEFEKAVAHETYDLIATHSTPTNSAAIVGIWDNGSQMDTLSFPGKVPHVSAWCPTQKILATSWGDGMMSLWFASDKGLREGNIHQSQITLFHWHSSGSRLLSVDKDGQAVVWKIDPRGRMVAMVQYRLAQVPIQTLSRAHARGNLVSFYLIATSGTVYLVDDAGHCEELAGLPAQPSFSTLIESHNLLVSVSKDLVLSKFRLLEDGKISQVSLIKLAMSTKGKTDFHSCIVKNSSLAINFSDSLIRIINFADSENETMTIPVELKENDFITGLLWNDKYQMLCGRIYKVSHESINLFSKFMSLLAKTFFGDLLMWRIINFDTITFQLVQNINTELRGTFDASWNEQGRLVMKGSESIRMFSSKERLFDFYKDVFCVQTSASKVAIRSSTKNRGMIDAQQTIKKIAITEEAVALWKGKTVEIFRHFPEIDSKSPIGFVPCDHDKFTIGSNGLFVITSNQLDIYNYEGVKKQSLIVHNDEPGFVTSNSGILAVSIGNEIKVYDIQRREPRLTWTKQLSSFIKITSIKINSNGAFLLINGTQLFSGDTSESKLFVYSTGNDTLLEYTMPRHTTILDCFWDVNDPRVLASYCEITDGQTQKRQVYSFYASQSRVGQFDCYDAPSETGQLVGVDIPNHSFIVEGSSQQDKNQFLYRHKLKLYNGIEEADSNVLRAVTDFSIHLAKKNIDEAVKAVKLISNTTVWENLALMSIKARRLDIAMLCLSKMGDAKILRSLRDIEDGSDEEKFGMIAMYFGLYDEAKEIYNSANRKDLLNNLYQLSGAWEASLDAANKIGTKKEFYKFGKYLLSTEDLTGAIAAFEKAGSHCIEVPKMLYNRNKMDELKKYVDAKEDKALKKWWAQYMESCGNIEQAIVYYKLADDTLSLARMYCYTGSMNEAILLIEATSNVAASYHVARYCEEKGKIAEAIVYYSKAKCYGNAIQVCKEHGMVQELMGLALQGSRDCMIDVAKYFENHPDHVEKAILLYGKSGSSGRAIELCFREKKFSLLQDIVQNLPSTTNPALLTKCASFFVENGIYDKACTLLLSTGKAKEALFLCKNHNVTITEEIAEALSTQNVEKNREIILQIADICLSQQNYLLACKKFMQVGERLKAMQALLRSGEKDKIIYFANVSGARQPDIYVMAANFLQSLDWRSDPSIMKAIITFYTKAKAFDSLASFYESCAQVEVDEFQNYSKAIDALNEALSCLESSSAIGKSSKLAAVERKIQLLGSFCNATLLASSDEKSALQICGELLKEISVNDIVKVGDIFALMIRILHGLNNLEGAQILLGQMKSRVNAQDISTFLDSDTLEWLEAYAQQNAKHSRHQTGNSEVSEFIEEEVP